MFLHDSLSHRLKKITKTKKTIKLFVCGPTVYDSMHIGHARTYIFFDSLVRFMRSQNYKIEFIHTTHSTIQCAFVALHSNEGIFFYALDFKFDNYPTLGEPPNYKRLKELGKKGIKVLIVDSLYSNIEKKLGGEKIAKQLLDEAFYSVNSKNSALFVTTFSSHIERLNNIVNLGKKKTVLLL